MIRSVLKLVGGLVALSLLLIPASLIIGQAVNRANKGIFANRFEVRTKLEESRSEKDALPVTMGSKGDKNPQKPKEGGVQAETKYDPKGQVSEEANAGEQISQSSRKDMKHVLTRIADDSPSAIGSDQKSYPAAKESLGSVRTQHPKQVIENQPVIGENSESVMIDLRWDSGAPPPGQGGFFNDGKFWLQTPTGPSAYEIVGNRLFVHLRSLTNSEAQSFGLPLHTSEVYILDAHSSEVLSKRINEKLQGRQVREVTVRYRYGAYRIENIGSRNEKNGA